MYLQRSDFYSLTLYVSSSWNALLGHTGYHLGLLDGSVESDR